MLEDSVAAPPMQIATFGGLITVEIDQTAELLATNGLTFTGKCIVSPETSSTYVAQVTVATDELATQYSSLNLYGGNVVEINPADGDVVVLEYDAGCGDQQGPFYFGGISFSLAKPSGIAVNGVMSCGVGVLGTEFAVFSGMVML